MAGHFSRLGFLFSGPNDFFYDDGGQKSQEEDASDHDEDNEVLIRVLG